MTINIIGDAPNIRRLKTGLWSFDRAFKNQKGEIGFPVGKGTEIFGPSHCGKSTIVYGLAGMLASEKEKHIALADLEGFDPDFLTVVLENAGYSGDVRYIQQGTDEEVLDDLVYFLRKDIYGVGIIDSVSAISPIAEQKGKHGEANWGRRANLVGQFSRKSVKIIRDKGDDAPNVFMINHAYPRVGGMGVTTPGGEAKKFLNSMRISVKRVYWKKKYEEYPDGSYVIEGKVIKNRWGLKGGTFWLFVLSGKGIHKGLTAMYDGIRLKVVNRKTEKHPRSISIGDKSFGALRKVVEKAQEGDDKFFEPFFEVLRNQEQDNEEMDEKQDDEKDEEK
jgi:RecA/RadA recombinase